MSLLNRLEDAWRILDRITGEVSPGFGCKGRSGDPGNCPSTDSEAEKLLKDIIGTAEYIREKLKVTPHHVKTV